MEFAAKRPRGNGGMSWSAQEEQALRTGVAAFGEGRWAIAYATTTTSASTSTGAISITTGTSANTSATTSVSVSNMDETGEGVLLGK